MAKLFWSEYHKKLGEIAVGIEGTDTLIRPEGGRTATRHRPVAERLPEQPGRDHLLRDERDPAQHHRRAGARPAQGAARGLTARRCRPGQSGRVMSIQANGSLAVMTQTSSLLAAAHRAGRRDASADRSARWSRRPGCASSSRRSRIALVGASDTSGWARFIVAASTATGFTGPLIPVHPKHDSAFGRPVVRNLRDLGRAGRPGLHPGPHARRGERARRRGRRRHPERRRPGRRLPRGRRRTAGRWSSKLIAQAAAAGDRRCSGRTAWAS